MAGRLPDTAFTKQYGLQTGVLPDEMVPDDNNELEESDADSDAGEEGPQLEGVTLPLQLGTLKGRTTQRKPVPIEPDHLCRHA